MRLVVIACLLLTSFAHAAQTPAFDEQRADWSPSYGWLLDRDGVALEADRLDFEGLRGPWVALADISPALPIAVVSIEDRRFFEHGGVDGRALLAAAWQTLRGHGRRGASTITMQLAGIIGPDGGSPRGRRGLRGKWAQMRAAWRIERTWTKAQILEAYLNRVSVRGELQGVGAAAASLFGKTPSGLTEAEAWLIASLIAAPNAELARAARRACLLAAHCGATPDCATLTAVTHLALERPPAAQPLPSLAPQLARQLLRRPGERVTTTLAAPVQRRVHEVLVRQLAGLADRNVRDGAAVVVDNATGEVLAYVGSAGRHSRAGAVDGARALRQAGSTLKPFLYGLAFERRYLTPASLLEDSPINLETSTGLYIPQNYDHRHLGPVSARTALAGSLNIPAVRALLLVGIENFHKRLDRLGYDDLHPEAEHYGFSLALGSAEVSLLQQANAYRVLANGGLWSPLRVVASPARAPEPRRVMPESAAFLVSDVLSDPAARAASFGLASPLATRVWAAVKTGTSKDMRDNWCIGYSDRYTVAVWVGNFEGDSMRDVSGVTGAAPAWAEIMQWLHEGRASRAPPVPAGVVAADVVFAPAVEPPRRGYFLAGTELTRVEALEKGPARARISSPANGATIMLDPDIPEANQLVILEGHGADASLEFYVDDHRLGTAERARRWRPVPGEHRVELRTRDGRVRDVARFTVRGG